MFQSAKTVDKMVKESLEHFPPKTNAANLERTNSGREFGRRPALIEFAPRSISGKILFANSVNVP